MSYDKYSCNPTKASVFVAIMANNTLPDLDPLAPRILEALLVSGMSRTQFGYVHFGDPAFITKLERGRKFRPATIEKINRVLKELDV